MSAAVEPAAARGGRNSVSLTTGRIGYWVASVLILVVFVAPLLWALLRAFQPTAAITQRPSGAAVTGLTWSNVKAVFGGSDSLWRYVGNSLLVAGGTALLVAVLTTLAGYGFARFRFRGAGLVFGLILVSMMVPFQAILTPLFLELNALHLTDSRLGLILFSTTMQIPFGVFVMRNSFAAVPREMEESARVDGANTAQVLLRVLRPLVTPGVATVLLFAFLATWTDFLGALTFITRSDLVTLPVQLSNLQQGVHGQVDFGQLSTGAIVSAIPCVLLYVCLQRTYVRGLTEGALKA
ncbi:carbohydrate ABC transporter permease [Streptomyces coelicoflavus]|uniref:carbohydrate ABC transporter permease n=1 Tax=Streptomyces coelicoflavus TaxID=285562 RepID=UPI0036273FEE